jgi:uncharacterized protein (DUF362 family)
MSAVYLEIDQKITEYPQRQYFFSPGICYPEYPFGEEFVSPDHNGVYGLIRKCFADSGYDREHYGTREWNPLGAVIHTGDTVLIKPNWVDNKNKNQSVNDDLACLVTNPSVIRAIVDYTLIALKGTGKIIVGDAPMQGCDLAEVFRIAGYDELWQFYRECGVELEIADLRKYSTESVYRGVLSAPKLTEHTHGSVKVDIGALSMHHEKDEEHPNYKVSDYKESVTASYHSGGRHEYEVNRIPLEADVIINVPKPKTHRLAGMTAAVKNFVGITYEKACLPHRVEGDKEHGGDAYLKKSKWKEWMHILDEKRTDYFIGASYGKSKFYDLSMKFCYLMSVITTGDKYRIGSWYGNDTIWRTSVDLNYIMLHADLNGELHDKPIRKILTIGDMIISGQGEGPVGPTPKPLGMIMMSENALLFDRAMCEIMGFDSCKLAVFNSNLAYERFGYAGKEELEQEMISVNGRKLRIKEFLGKEEWKFEPHSCWKGYVESRGNA